MLAPVYALLEGVGVLRPGYRTVRAPHRSTRSPLRFDSSSDRIVVWLDARGRSKKIGSLSKQLVTDAGRQGQDLVGELVDTALRQAEREA